MTGLAEYLEHAFTATARNGAGVETAAGPSGAAWTLDVTPPTGSVEIDGGAAYTNTTAVTLALSASDTGSGVADMQFSNDGVVWSGWEAYAATIAWTLDAGDGLKTVYVQYRDHANNVSTGLITDSITLDTEAPAGTILINGGAAYTTTMAVTLALSASDAVSGVADMRFSNDGTSWSGWEPYAASKAWTLGAGDGLKTVHVQYRDHAGNPSPLAITDSITLDTIAPNTPTVSGPVLTNEPRPTWTWTPGGGGNGVYQYELDASGVWVETTATAFTPGVDLADGLYTLRVRERDDAGNWSASGSHTLTISSAALGAALHQTGPEETGANSVSFAVTFSRAVAPTFDAGVVSVTGTLGGAVAVSGADPAYTVTVTLADPDADGTVGIAVAGGVVEDAFGNVYAGGASPLYQIWNWREPWFTEEPAGARKYVGDTHSFSATANCGASTLVYQWKWDDGAKAEHLGPAMQTWPLTNLTLGHGGTYWCEASYDGDTHATAPATLQVAPPLLITQQPQGGQKDIGASHSFTVVATGGYTPLSYQWRKGEAVIPDAPDAMTFALTDLDESDSGLYDVVVTDDNGASVVSDTAVLLVGTVLPATNAVLLAALVLALALGTLRAATLSRLPKSHRG